MAPSSRRWCFTLNNYTDAEVRALLACVCVYLCIGREVGPENGVPHLQGFVIFDKPVRLTFLKRLSARAHWEAARGSSKQAADYCKKDGSFDERGDLPASAADAGGDAERARWDDARKRARDGDIDNVPSDIYIRYYRTLKEIAKDHMAKPSDADGVTGVWIYGAAGVGKSRRARQDYPDAYFKMQNKWWDGYQGEDFVILDDFDSKELGHLLKIWADRYSFVAETKGGAIHIRPKKFVITSNYPIEHFDWDAEMTEAIRRRFEVIHME